jgi:hypothetical protein
VLLSKVPTVTLAGFFDGVDGVLDIVVVLLPCSLSRRGISGSGSETPGIKGVAGPYIRLLSSKSPSCLKMERCLKMYDVCLMMLEYMIKITSNKFK